MALLGFSECVDSSGDGDPRGDLLFARIAGVQSASVGRELRVSWETTAPVNFTSTIGYYINVGSYQIGLRQIDNEVVRFVFDLTDNKQQNLTTDYGLDGSATATLTVPLDALPKLDEDFEYQAVVTADGDDLDACEGTFVTEG